MRDMSSAALPCMVTRGPGAEDRIPLVECTLTRHCMRSLHRMSAAAAAQPRAFQEEESAKRRRVLACDTMPSLQASQPEKVELSQGGRPERPASVLELNSPPYSELDRAQLGYLALEFLEEAEELWCEAMRVYLNQCYKERMETTGQMAKPEKDALGKTDKGKKDGSRVFAHGRFWFFPPRE